MKEMKKALGAVIEKKALGAANEMNGMPALGAVYGRAEERVWRKLVCCNKLWDVRCE